MGRKKGASLVGRLEAEGENTQRTEGRHKEEKEEDLQVFEQDSMPSEAVGGGVKTASE